MSDPRDDDPSESPGSRIEPRLGWLEGLRFRDPSQAYEPRERKKSRIGWWALAVAIALAAGVLSFRQTLADWLWPETRAQVLRERAAAALAVGHLTAPEDGSGARELYEAALALDPDRNEAREGLMRVADAAMQQAREAIAQNRYADAHEALQLARALSAPRAKSDAVAVLMRKQEAEHAGIDGLLARAAAAREAGKLDEGPDSALPLYQRVLALQPARTEALEAREDTLADLLQQAKAAMDGGRLADAAKIVGRVAEYDAGHVALPEARAQLARAVERQRQRADRDLRGGRLEAAMAGYRKLLDIDAEDGAALAGIERVGNAYAQRAEQRAADFRFAEAQADLRAASGISPGSAAVRDAARHVERIRKAQSRVAPTMPPRERAGKVSALLAESDRAAARGDWLTPPGDSAYDKLRAAQALAPNDAAVKRAAARALPSVRRCYEDELRGNSLKRAQACLDAWQQLAPNDRATGAARSRLAQRWIAVGNERLGAGEVAFAEQALASARALDAGAPGLDEFATRVKTAAGSGR
ncbi:hypothetical protein M2650_07625 [Luteimonas sp. SX5]|uniref:Tetratricopeptide repeat protein n=1 Tax=Luteimonas galliterrae TaxID=2940486 RepID=A0ABT0MI14_9GAMM|nr:hypothetical protein [Luteimonas galliterrae]MCL1634500.1 hypothetical protein [Luteimonas galliterrae]